MAEAEPRIAVETGAFVRRAKDGVYVRLRVSPGARSTAIKGVYRENAVKLSVAAPPTNGRANAEVERYVARLLGVSRSVVTITRGASSRDKLVFVAGVEENEVRASLDKLH